MTLARLLALVETCSHLWNGNQNINSEKQMQISNDTAEHLAWCLACDQWTEGTIVSAQQGKEIEERSTQEMSTPALSQA